MVRTDIFNYYIIVLKMAKNGRNILRNKKLKIRQNDFLGSDYGL